MARCPFCKNKINPASMLGAMNAGGKKRLTPKDKAARRLRLAEARKKRWPKKHGDHLNKGGKCVSWQ
jgi:hypothetical protein